MVLRNLQSLKNGIENKKIFQLLSKLEDKGRRDREKARTILFPKSNFNEANCVNIWFESEEAKQEEANGIDDGVEDGDSLETSTCHEAR